MEGWADINLFEIHATEPLGHRTDRVCTSLYPNTCGGPLMANWWGILPPQFLVQAPLQSTLLIEVSTMDRHGTVGAPVGHRGCAVQKRERQGVVSGRLEPGSTL